VQDDTTTTSSRFDEELVTLEQNDLFPLQSWDNEHNRMTANNKSVQFMARRNDEARVGNAPMTLRAAKPCELQTLMARNIWNSFWNTSGIFSPQNLGLAVRASSFQRGETSKARSRDLQAEAKPETRAPGKLLA
jgi:hypothetical protein